MPNFWSRTKKSQKVVPLANIKEDDFLLLNKLLGGNDKALLEFVESFCSFWMFVWGHADEHPEATKKLEKIIEGLNESNNKEIKLPEPFETSRKILLKVRKKEDFERILKEVRASA